MAAGPAYTRLENDERRRRLLELGARLFTEHAYDEISMSQIARAAGISKALLYHYFPSKRDYFVATLAGGAEELRARAMQIASALAEAHSRQAAGGEDRQCVGLRLDLHARHFRRDAAASILPLIGNH